MKAIIFDFDGVINDVPKIQVVAGTKTFLDFKIDITKEDLAYIMPRHPIDYAKHFVEKYGLDEQEIIKKHQNYFLSNYDTVELMPNAREVLLQLKENHKIALATSSPLAPVLRLFDKLKLNNIFDVIVTFDDCKERKPSPEVYNKAIAKLNMESKNCYIVEDSVVGITAGNLAGATSIAFKNQYNGYEDFSCANYTIKSLTDISEVVKQ